MKLSKSEIKGRKRSLVVQKKYVGVKMSMGMMEWERKGNASGGKNRCA